MVEKRVQKIITTKITPTEGKDRVLEFVGSTETVDRDGEVIKADAWQLGSYNKNPVVQWAHDYQSPPIGKTLSIERRGTDTVFQIQFATSDEYAFADTVYKLCKGGYLNATSVGFIPIEYEKAKKQGDPSRTFTKVELLEISIVPVPSNPDALVSARNAGIITVKDFDRITKPEETADYIRIPVRECKITATIDISAKEGIKALYCGEEKEIATYLFAKDKGWTMEKAKAWVKEHSKEYVIGETTTSESDEIMIMAVKIPNTPQVYMKWKQSKEHPKSISQVGIMDELDYLDLMIKEAGLNDENKAKLFGLAGNHIPVQIKAEATIRDAITPIIKLLTDGFSSEEKCYKACKEALEGIMAPEMPETINLTLPTQSLREFLKEEIKRQIMEV
mgnify:CR=1 FL=1